MNHGRARCLKMGLLLSNSTSRSGHSRQEPHPAVGDRRGIISLNSVFRYELMRHFPTMEMALA
jgi:hypothetical protein